MTIKKTSVRSERRGRPRTTINPKLVEALAAMCLTQQEIANTVGCSVDTLQRRYHNEWQRGRSKASATIRQKQFKLAIVDENVRMLIHLDKVLCGQRE